MTRILVLARLRRALLLVGLVFAALPAASALADTTIGQVGGNLNCGASAWWADTSYIVPSGGTITSFSFQSDATNAGQQLDFLALRPVAGGYTVVGKTGLVTLVGAGVETFAANAPVRAGDVLGLWESGELNNCVRDGSGTTNGNNSTD
ncbi:MAG: hypothetical protein ACXVUL_22060, partial [Solirubrobacteraceae bacterium]